MLYKLNLKQSINTYLNINNVIIHYNIVLSNVNEDYQLLFRLRFKLIDI